MATDKRGVTGLPHIFKVTTTQDEWVEVQLPAQTNAISLSSEGKIYVGFNDCTDAGSVSDAANFIIDQEVIFTLTLGRGNSRHSSIFLSSDNDDVIIRVMLLE